MKTFYEEISEKAITEKWNNLLPILQSTEVILIGNVFDYYWAHNKEEIDIRKIPNAAPPFENMWLEYKSSAGGAYREFGFLFTSIRNPGFENRWEVCVTFFVKENGQIVDFPDTQCLAVGRYKIDGNGIFVPFIDEKQYWQCSVSSLCLDKDRLVSILSSMVYPAFLSISFMHCKNVELIQKGKGTQRHGRDRHGAKIKYKILEIYPMKTVLKTEGDIEHVGIKKALHICRGHFKDYRERGLFGKYQGLYWWDSHVRGNIESGIVDKDYSINPKVGDE